ncbi:MAG: hypothetical protein ACRYGG_00990 [Janthinobacterium lividum]
MSDKTLVTEIEGETDLAYAIKDTKGVIVWLPKSQISLTKNRLGYSIILPKWLADKYSDLEFEED